MIDPSGVWVRPEGQHFLCGCSPERDPEVAHNDFEPRFREFEEIIWPALAARSPAFEAIKMQACGRGTMPTIRSTKTRSQGHTPKPATSILPTGFRATACNKPPRLGVGWPNLWRWGAIKALIFRR